MKQQEFSDAQDFYKAFAETYSKTFGERRIFFTVLSAEGSVIALGTISDGKGNVFFDNLSIIGVGISSGSNISFDFRELVQVGLVDDTEGTYLEIEMSYGRIVLLAEKE